MSLEAEVEAEAEAEFEVEAVVAFEAFAKSHREAPWERARLVQVSGGCRRDEAWEAGL